jgi:hypothetical protein
LLSASKLLEAREKTIVILYHATVSIKDCFTYAYTHFRIRGSEAWDRQLIVVSVQNTKKQTSFNFTILVLAFNNAHHFITSVRIVRSARTQTSSIITFRPTS